MWRFSCFDGSRAYRSKGRWFVTTGWRCHLDRLVFVCSLHYPMRSEFGLPTPVFYEWTTFPVDLASSVCLIHQFNRCSFSSSWWVLIHHVPCFPSGESWCLCKFGTWLLVIICSLVMSSCVDSVQSALLVCTHLWFWSSWILVFVPMWVWFSSLLLQLDWKFYSELVMFFRSVSFHEYDVVGSQFLFMSILHR